MIGGNWLIDWLIDLLIIYLDLDDTIRPEQIFQRIYSIIQKKYINITYDINAWN